MSVVDRGSVDNLWVGSPCRWYDNLVSLVDAIVFGHTTGCYFVDYPDYSNELVVHHICFGMEVVSFLVV